MTDKEKVIKELKEALDSLDITNAYRINLIRAIEHLQEEPVSEDLEEEIQDYYNSRREYGGRYNAVIPVYRHQLADIASHFAQWQKQQLMAKAVNGFVIKDIEEGNGDFLLSADYLPKDMGLKDRQKVKVIVIKED